MNGFASSQLGLPVQPQVRGNLSVRFNTGVGVSFVPLQFPKRAYIGLPCPVGGNISTHSLQQTSECTQNVKRYLDDGNIGNNELVSVSNLCNLTGELGWHCIGLGILIWVRPGY